MNIGISDMALYVPAHRMGLDRLLQRRSQENPEIERRLRRAIESTAQEAIRFPAPWQDSVTLAAHASTEVLQRSGAAADVRYVAVGTETSVDMSKPIAAYAHGVMQRAGVPLSGALSTFQVQHACAGGTIAMLSVAGMLKCAAREGESGLVVCSDVARYEAPSTAEITQGAGAVAMLIERDPRLLQLELDSVGFASSDVDDFFRPLGSIIASVKGRYSVDCYNEALDAAVRDHASRLGRTPREVIETTDIFVLHVPFYKMAVTGLSSLVARYLETTPEQTAEFLASRRFGEGIEPTKQIGNIYSGSAYMAMMFSLADQRRHVGDAIVGKRVLIASYGSGNTMSVVAGTVAPEAGRVIGAWNLDAVLNGGLDADFGLYERWVAPERYEAWNGTVAETAPAGHYFLKSIREDGYREYDYAT